MTYKELIFKMAKRGMLSLSNDKDGRGLFWMGMSNMEALEKDMEQWVEEFTKMRKEKVFDKSVANAMANDNVEMSIKKNT